MRCRLQGAASPGHRLVLRSRCCRRSSRLHAQDRRCWPLEEGSRVRHLKHTCVGRHTDEHVAPPRTVARALPTTLTPLVPLTARSSSRLRRLVSLSTMRTRVDAASPRLVSVIWTVSPRLPLRPRRRRMTSRCWKHGRLDTAEQTALEGNIAPRCSARGSHGSSTGYGLRRS